MNNMWKFFIIISLLLTKEKSVLANRPNIVIIISDDMGFDDVSFRGSNEFLTPNIDALAYNGVILNNLYTPAMCTPSRAALLTGKYPINTGMQHYVLVNDQPWSLPVNETTMGEIFQEHGYYTSLIGKWHLGMSRKIYTPTFRGFDYHYGYLGSYVDYYDHTLIQRNKNYSRGHDFRLNLESMHDQACTYVTDLLTEESVNLIKRHDYNAKPLFLMLNHLAPHSANEDVPLQAPESEIDKFSYIKDPQRKIYAAMMSALDNSVGQVIEALADMEVLNNTIVLFFSDNGGPTIGLHANTASNYPLRGQKNSPWEGGIRSSGAIWSTQLEKLGSIWQQTFYIADFLPTLASAVGIYLDIATLKLDGLNLWSALKYGYERVEREILHNIDDVDNYVSYSKGKWKFINGTTQEGKYDDWLSKRADNNTLDPRSLIYEEIIKNTTVWQKLQKFNISPSIVNITKLRQAAAVKCLEKDSNLLQKCEPLKAPCLFDLDSDPCEQKNLYDEQHKNSKIVLEMLERIDNLRRQAHPMNNKPADPRCDPINYNNEWTWWEDILESNATALASFTNYMKPLFILSTLVLLL
uniref:Sulfatase N-terminal domain-containing protein n=1 Tax=Glossina brevipalpis TaxID=37001 RepID=A0A1A9WE45_9MUSC